MDGNNSPPSPTWLPSARPQGTSSFSFARSPLSPTIAHSQSTRSPPPTRPLSSSTHLLQDLEPRTYESGSEASYRDSPPVATQSHTRKVKGKGRWEEMQAYTDGMEEERHPLDPRPEPISRRRSRDEAQLPRWARSTEAGRSGSLPSTDGRLEEVQPGWLRGPPKEQHIKFSIPPPITASVMIPPGSVAGTSGKGSDESILSSIFGAFPGTGRSEKGSEKGAGVGVGRNRTSRLGEEWTDIVRQERVLQSRIQELLDMQAAGLQSARDGDTRADSRSSMRSSTTLSGRKEMSGKRKLHVARMELLKAMYTLSDLAAAKEAVLEETSQTLETAHRQLLTWQHKLSIADAKLRAIEGHPETGISTEETLDRQIRDVEREIEELEDRLRKAKEKKKRLLKKRTESRSVKEASASKYHEAKREITQEVTRWLRDPSIPSDMLEADSYWSNFLELNPKRRELEGAVECLAGAIRGVRKRIAGVKVERDACERGAKVWSESLEVVMKSEKGVREWMERSLRGRDGKDGLEGLLGYMEEVEGKLEEALDGAEREGWTLVVCVIGAEFEAWRVGGEVLRGMVGGDKTSRMKRGKREWTGNSQMAEFGTEMEETGTRRQRGHSFTTNSTEDPMWGSGVDKDAEILPGMGSAPDLDVFNQLQQETILELGPNKERRDSDGRKSEQSVDTEGEHIIHTEGLKISPSHSPWAEQKVKSGMSTPRLGRREESEEREVSFRTALEHSVVADADGDGESGSGHRNGKDRREARERSESPMPLTPREERVPPHRRKGKGQVREKMDGGAEESDDGEVPVDLLG